MSFIADVLGFEKFNLSEIGEKIKDSPERLLVGAIDPASTKIWNKVLGKGWDPAVDQMGGATAGTYDKAKAAGIDTRPGHAVHDVAHVVAGAAAAAYGLDALGAGSLGAADGATVTSAEGAASSVGGGVSAAEGVGAGTEAAGIGGAPGSSGSSGSAASGGDYASSWKDWVNGSQGQMTQPAQQRQSDQYASERATLMARRDQLMQEISLLQGKK